MSIDAETYLIRRRILGAVTWLGVILLGGWMAWCATFQLAGAPAEAEIVSTRTEQHRTRKGRKYSNTYGVVRYADVTGRTHTDEVELYGNATVGRIIPVRYLPSRPGDCRRDNFWGIWGLAVMVSGAFALIVTLIWYAERLRRPKPATRNPFARTPG